MAIPQTPDDLYCRPVRFQKVDSDGSVVRTFGIYSPWPRIQPIGEMEVRETLDGAVHLCLTLEEGWQDVK